jgi:hypothetical protein
MMNKEYLCRIGTRAAGLHRGARFGACAAWTFALLLAAHARADDAAVSVHMGIGVRWDFMQIINSTNVHPDKPLDSEWLDGFWMQSLKSTLNVDAAIGDRASVRLQYYGIVQFTTPSDPEVPIQSRVYGGLLPV